MGGTPLNNTMFVIPELVRRFRSYTKAQKVSFCVLTDGESSPLVYWERRQSRSYDGQVETYSRPCYAYYQRMMSVMVTMWLTGSSTRKTSLVGLLSPSRHH